MIGVLLRHHRHPFGTMAICDINKRRRPRRSGLARTSLEARLAKVTAFCLARGQRNADLPTPPTSHIPLPTPYFLPPTSYPLLPTPLRLLPDCVNNVLGGYS